jgi:molybdopterin converting factor small subunit
MAAVTVRYFAVLRERRGVDEERVDTLPGETVEALYLRLFPPGAEGALPVAYAVGQERVPARTELPDGAEVAFLPPLGGG